MSNDYINNFIARKKEWIEKKLKEIEKKNKDSKLDDNEKCKIINYLGKEYPLEIKKSDENILIFDNEEKFILYISNENNIELKKKIINNFYVSGAKILFKELLDYYLDITGNSINEFKVKTLRSNWGSCNYRKKIINLNSELMKKNIKFIEYVVLHEIAHLVHPNHSKNFYNYIEIYMSDWKLRKKI